VAWLLIAQSFGLLHYGTKSSKGVPAIRGIITYQLLGKGTMSMLFNMAGIAKSFSIGYIGKLWGF
jgi:hypothetical protein